MEKNNELETLQFTTREEFVKFLRNYFKRIGTIDELIIFAHQVNDWKSDTHSSNPIEKTMGILNSGLAGRKYSSSDGTLNNIGTIFEEKTIYKILDYDYHDYKGKTGRNCYPTVILAFPKTIKVNGEYVPYTSSPYTRNNKDYIKKLDKLFNKGHHNLGLSTDQQFAPKTWLDVINGLNDYSVSDNLFAFYQDKDSVYHVILPHTHWFYQGKEAYEEYKTKIAEKIAKKGASLEDALVKKAEQCQPIIDSFLDEI